MAFEYSQEDVARSIVVEEKVTLPFKVEKYEEKPSKDNTSINHVHTFKCLNSEDGKYNGMQLVVFFSEKAPSMAFPYLRAMGWEPERGGGRVNFEQYVGRNVLIEVKPGTYNNQPANEVISYRPIDE